MAEKIDEKNDLPIEEFYSSVKLGLEKFPFIIIIGKYDQILGPRALYSSFELKNDNFVRNLLRDSLNTKNKFVILDFNKFYSQVCKIEIEDDSARGRKQLYGVILFRDGSLPMIPIIHLKRLEMLFYSIDNIKILNDDNEAFQKFYDELISLYMNKDEILPLESVNMQIRSGINTIQGFCDLILEEHKSKGSLSEDNVLNYVEMMIDSCNDMTDSLENFFNSEKSS